ncbi:MAG: hypothetical protein AB8H79_06190 [Myxococcota bacterium]
MVFFAVDRSFMHLGRDQVVLVGRVRGGLVEPGDLLDVPGLGEVEIASVESVAFADGRQVPCVCFAATAMESSPEFEPASLDGTELQVVPQWS